MLCGFLFNFNEVRCDDNDTFGKQMWVASPKLHEKEHRTSLVLTTGEMYDNMVESPMKLDEDLYLRHNAPW